MSWVDTVNNDLIITTGDGVQYRPLWLNAQKSVEYNVAEFEFINVAGTHVARKLPKGIRYSLEMYFTGENHLDTSAAFEKSSADPRAWTISHPMYGSITVQPLGLAFDNSQYNSTTISGEVVETINFTGPQTNISVVDQIAADKAAMDATAATAFAAAPPPGVDETTNLTQNANTLFGLGISGATTDLDAETYRNLFNTANAAVVDATAQPLVAAQATQSFINYPAQFTDTVTARIAMLQSQFDALNINITGYDTPGLKLNYELTATALISSMAIAASTPQAGNYTNRTQVLGVITQLLANYNGFVTYIDFLQTPTGGSPASYIPNAAVLLPLTNLINLTVSSLFIIAIGAKQERTVILDYDSNPIVLTHRFYGLSDANFELFIDTNNIGLSEMLQIKKGKKLVWYV